jgi:hypothetical protein
MSDSFPYSDSDPENFFRIRPAQKLNRFVRIGIHITGPEAKKHPSREIGLNIQKNIQNNLLILCL